jgi:hypothetical protein
MMGPSPIGAGIPFLQNQYLSLLSFTVPPRLSAVVPKERHESY